VSTNVSEEHIASIFRVEKISSVRSQRGAFHLLARWLLAELILSTSRMEAICSSETLVDTQRTTRRYILEVDTLNRRIVGRVVFNVARVASRKVGE
jgi:hypothetical protein